MDKNKQELQLSEQQMEKIARARSVINDIYSDVKELKAQDKGHLSEEIFKNYFLPFFQGKTPPEDAEQYVTQWKTIAGDLQNPVVIVDSTDKKTELFEIPPFFNAAAINPLRGTGTESIAEILYAAEQHQHLSPILGQNVLETKFAQKAQEIINKDLSVQGLEEKWVAIFERYADRTPSSGQKAVNKASDKFSDDEMQF